MAELEPRCCILVGTMKLRVRTRRGRGRGKTEIDERVSRTLEKCRLDILGFEVSPSFHTGPMGWPFIFHVRKTQRPLSAPPSRLEPLDTGLMVLNLRLANCTYEIITNSRYQVYLNSYKSCKIPERASSVFHTFCDNGGKF